MNRKKGKNFLSFMLLILIFVLSACTQDPELELYEGKALSIAVVGELPKVEEEQVRFNEISFDELASEELGTYDAVFITEENLPKAAESQYADVYLNSTIPFFFIGTDNFVPFTEKDLEYDKTSYWDGSYAVGVLTSQEDESLKTWGFGLYNDKKTDEHIKDVYSRIFKTIEELNR
ncbi:hypothetical protein ACFSFW_00770 [Fredinandcohnia salidurans]|uniref:Lipoprotein n=1 Tax=Fredinandcohnia salidurans TaxID=2595041 RepID=A0ABW4MH91_9BACI